MKKELEIIKNKILDDSFLSLEEMKEDLKKIYKIANTTKNKNLECEAYLYYNRLNKLIEEEKERKGKKNMKEVKKLNDISNYIYEEFKKGNIKKDVYLELSNNIADVVVDLKIKEKEDQKNGKSLL